MSRQAIETDVLVVGGGIAGIATAERIAREAARREKRIRLILCEAESHLGSGASAGLEGWYHSGSLYAHAPDLSFTRGCMQGLADLLKHYAFDQSFTRRTQCNAQPFEIHSRTPTFNLSRAGWFRRPVDLLLPKSQPAEVSDRIRGAIGGLYFGYPWLNEQGSIQEPAAPAPAVDRDGFDDMLRESGHADTLLATQQRLANLRRETVGPAVDVECLPSLDMSMDTQLILSDLASHASGLGVEIRAGSRLTSWDGRTAGFVDSRGKSITITPKQCIFATGAAPIGGVTAPDFGPRAVLKRWTSVMVTVTPALSPSCFVLLSNDRRLAFNHFCHTGANGDYSIIADANAAEGDLSQASIRAIADRIREKARIWFGDHIKRRSTRHHSCSKIEVSPCPSVARSYSVVCSPTGNRANGSNELWVVPGKFSLFATLGETIHREMDRRGLYDSLAPGRATPHAFDRRKISVSKSAGLSLMHAQGRATRDAYGTQRGGLQRGGTQRCQIEPT